MRRFLPISHLLFAHGRRGPAALLVIHDMACVECLMFIRNLSHYQTEVSVWGGRILVIASADGIPSSQAALPDSIETIQGAAERLHVQAPAVIVADEWGEIFFQANLGHDFIAPEKLVEWIQFVAIQCPECEQPEGAWKDM